MHIDVCQVQTAVIRVPILKNWSKMTKGRIKSTIVKLTLAPATPRHQLSFYTSFHQTTLAETTSGALCNSP